MAGTFKVRQDGIDVVDIHSRRELVSVSVAMSEERTIGLLGFDVPGGTQFDTARSATTDLARRPGALRPSVNEDNKAQIQIIAKRGEKRVAIGSFTDFILTDVQEQDSEKVSVVETFGAPHVFTADRFMRKFTFVGVCRASAPNYQTRSRAELYVPQQVRLRVFYDQYLRATQQARTERFTRVIVDGDAYDGYVTSLNLGRTSQNEHFVSFTISMLGVRRSHQEFEREALGMLSKFDVEDEEYVKYDIQRAQAELTDTLGELDLSVRYGDAQGFKSTAVSPNTLTFDTQDAVEKLKEEVFTVKSVGTAQILTTSVEGKVPPGAIRLVYLDGGDVHGTLARTQEDETSEPPDNTKVHLEVVNYRP
jgi:hypothetical protein